MSPAATRLGVRLFTVSVGINAALGIVALLGGAFGDLQGRVLATSFLVSAAMGSVLVNVPAQRRPIRPPLPLVGAIGGAGGFSILILMAWIDDVPEPLLKLAASGLTVGAAATLAAALRLVGHPATARWLSAVTEAAIAALAATILLVVWGGGGGGTWIARLIGIESVVVAAGTLLLPVLTRFSSSRDAGPPGTITCPHCGEPIDVAALDG